MKKVLFFFSLFILTISSAFAQSLENSLLWEVSGNGLEKPSYLFGTIHLSCDPVLSDKVLKALDKTDQLVLELDMDDPAMQSKMMGGMMMKGGKTIKDFVTEEEFTAIDSLFIKNMGISVSLIQNVKPSLLGAMLFPKLIDCPIKSYEDALMKITKEQEEETFGLETVEEQLAVFDAIPYEEQVKDLIRSAKDNLRKDKENLTKMFQVYKDENINKMLAMMNDEDAGSMGKYQDKLLDDRNKNWISRITKIANEKSTFFGVGAGHLAGENGVIKLLRKAGFTVKAVQ